MRELASGFGSAVYETPGGTVFRVARTAEAAVGHALEARLLPALAPGLPVRVPQPTCRIQPGRALPHGAIGHEKLVGEPLRPDDASDALAADVGSFLRALHAFPVEGARRLGVPVAAPWRERVLELTDLLPVLQPRLRPAERRALDAWWRTAPEDPAMATAPHVLRHGDAWYENLLADGEPSRLTAVLDWGAAAVGDPAEDLAPQFYLGPEFGAAVLAAYGADTALRQRVRRFRELREFAGLRWAVEHEDDEEVGESVEKLRRSPIFTA